MIAAATTLPTPPPARDYISFSAIRTYQQCPLRYFFRYIAGLPEETVSASLVFGSAIHRAIEFHFRELMSGLHTTSLHDLMGEYRKQWNQAEAADVRLPKGETIGSLEDMALRMLTAFMTHSLSRPDGRILGIEEQLRGEIVPGLPDLLSRIDLIVETPEELVISDWKTSRAKWSDGQVEDAMEQLLLYSELASDFAPGKRVRLEFVVLTKTKQVALDHHSTVADPNRLARTKRVVERVWRSIEAEHFYPVPSPMNCGSCPYREPCRKWPG
jgi:putative RecB family exonuclease